MLNDVKNYLRVDTEDDDSLIELIIDTAKGYVYNSVGYIDMGDPRFKMLIFVICAELYEKRTYLLDKNFNRNKIISSLILQLELAKDSD